MKWADMEGQLLGLADFEDHDWKSILVWGWWHHYLFTCWWSMPAIINKYLMSAMDSVKSGRIFVGE